MQIFKKLLIIILVLFFAKNAFASLEITEIMYAPEDGSAYEWVEIYNEGSESIDLNKYRFFHGEDNSAPLALKNGSTSVLKSGEYAVVAKSSQSYSWLPFSGLIFSASTLSLPDSGENTYIAISDPDKNIIDSLTYDTSLGGSKTSRNSLSKINNQWQGSVPTPGEENTETSSSTDEDNSNNDTDNTENKSDSSTNPKKVKEPEIVKMKTDIVANSPVFAKSPFEFGAVTTGIHKEPVILGRFVWNFGDGMTREDKVYTPFTYIYQYPGDYVVTLSYYGNTFVQVPDATDRMIIKVLPAELVIVKVGDINDPYVEIQNKSNAEISLSRWVLSGLYHSFTIPNGMIILPKKSVVLSSVVTGFGLADVSKISLTSPTGTLMSTYPALQISEISNSSNTVYKKAPSIPNDDLNKNKDTINLNDLPIEANTSKIPLGNKYLPVLGLVVLIIVGVFAFVLGHKNPKIVDSDFDNIKSSDMKIIE